MKRHVWGLGFLTVMIAVFVFASGGFCQDLVATCDNVGPATDICPECSKCPVAPIPCPEAAGQGETTQPLTPFDFDGEAWSPEDDPDVRGFGSYGYCPNKGYNYAENNMRDCKFIQDVCLCPDSCEIKPGTKVGIQMIVDVDGDYATDDGVYFADPTLNTIWFEINAENDRYIQNGLCQRTADDRVMHDIMGAATFIYGNEEETILLTSLNDPRYDHTVNKVPNFGTINYYRNIAVKETQKDGRNLCDIQLSTLGTPLDGPYNGAIPPINRVRALESDERNDYMFNEENAVGHCYFWIDIPAIRIDGTRVEEIRSKGGEIKVTVRLLFNRDIDSICEDCEPPDYCECEIVVAKICCDAPELSQCMYFPYVLFNRTDAWQSGIAVTNLSGNSVDTPQATFTLTDAAGNAYTAVQNLTSVVNTWMLDTMLTNFTWTPSIPAGSQVGWLQVEGNFDIDGYSFVTDGTFGAGTLPRQVCP